KERIVVNFLLENFKDVGVQTVTPKGVEKDITRISNYYKNCCIITGNTGAKKILLTNILKLLTVNDVPLFYSN
ncbi:MAG: hypothetical protein OEY51_10320, partial [Cyclobacteriaceae bacterium]|nr:hypothetical protein [Cyclobacteriaceae bacterium]